MVKLIEAFTRKSDAPPDAYKPLAPVIGAKLLEAEQRLKGLEAKADEAALEAATDSNGARQRAEHLEKQIAAARAEVERLHRAHALAARRDSAASARGRVRAQRQRFEALKANAEARQQAAAELAGAIEVASAAYKRFLLATERMVNGLPEGLKWPSGYAMHLSPAAGLVAAEMHRHGGVSRPGQQGFALPGAKPPHINFMFNPAAIEPIADVIGRSNDYLLGSIEVQITLREQAAADIERE